MNKIQRIFTMALLCCVAASSVFAQDITASLAGTVVDPSGAVVRNAKVTVFSVDTQRDIRTVTTDNSATSAFPV